MEEGNAHLFLFFSDHVDIEVKVRADSVIGPTGDKQLIILLGTITRAEC